MKRSLVRRKLTAELTSSPSKRKQSSEVQSVLEHLVDEASAKVQFDDFTAKDRAAILETFVNTEKVWLHMYDQIFGSSENQSLNSPKAKTLDCSEARQSTQIDSQSLNSILPSMVTPRLQKNLST